MFVARKWKRALEAARRDRAENRFWGDLREEIQGGSLRPQDFRLREIFEEFVDGGREIVSSWSPRSGGGSGGVMLSEESVNTAAFANITGQIVFSAMMEAFEDPVFIGDQLVKTVPTEFSGEKIPGIGRLGDAAETVEEGGAYPSAGLAEEWVETPETTKRGFIVPVTKEAIFFDRTGLVLQRAGEVGFWLALNKEKRILDAATGISTLYRRNGGTAIATYGDNSGSHDWDNLAASNALQDWTDVENVLSLFDDITDPMTGEPVLCNPNQLLVPGALYWTAARIVNATEIREVSNTNTTTIAPNPLRSSRAGNNSQLKILSNQYVKARSGSPSSYYLGDFQRAFWYMENWGPTSVQAPVNSEAEFTRDIVQRFKISERGAVACVQPRVVAKGTT